MVSHQAPPPKVGDGFHFGSVFWESLFKEPWIKKVIEEKIEENVKDRVAAETEVRFSQLEKTITEAAEKKGYADGTQKGMAEATEKVNAEFALLKAEYEAKQTEILEKAKELTALVMKEKQNILKDHEEHWCRALRNLLESFQVENALNLSAGIEAWMHERMSEFNSKDKLQVYLSATEYASVRAQMDTLGPLPWEFFPDEHLQAGQMRAECGDGGLFFSRPDAMETLKRSLAKHSKEETLNLETEVPAPVGSST